MRRVEASGTPSRPGHDDKGTLSEHILKEIYALYSAPFAIKPVGSPGLEAIGKEARIAPPILHPRRRITVMVIGNHSAGKSRSARARRRKSRLYQ